MVHRDLISGGVLAAVAVAYFAATLGMPVGQGEPGPSFVPRVLAVALFMLGLATVVGGVTSSRRARALGDEPTDGPPATAGQPPEVKKAWQAVGLTAAYVMLFEPLGFALSTLAYTFGVTVLFQRERSSLLFIVPPLCTLAIYLFFRVGLGARLPAGFFG